MVPNFRPKSPCECPNLSKLVDKHKAQLASKHKAPNSDSSQDRYVTPSDNIPVMVGNVQAQKQPGKQQTHRKINVRSDWSDSDDGKDNQARGKPIVYDITSDQEMDMDQLPSTSAPLRRPNTWCKVLTCGRGRGKFPLANWTSMTKGHGCRHITGCEISQAPLLFNNQELTVERNIAVGAPMDRVQTYEGNLDPNKSRKNLANWSWVRLGN